MKCVFCGGPVTSGVTTFSYEDEGVCIFVEHVPADICFRCGEKTYSPDVTDALLQLAKRQMEPIKVMQIPVYDFAQAAGM